MRKKDKDLFTFAFFTACVAGTAIVVIVLTLLLLTGCAVAPVNCAVKPNNHVARVTYYSSHEDKYGSKIAMGGRAHEGVTVAAPPDWHFGQHICIPALKGLVGTGHFIVQDRGSAVTSRKAIFAQTNPIIPKYSDSTVFDVYLAGPKRYCQHKMIELTRKVGYYTDYIPE